MKNPIFLLSDDSEKINLISDIIHNAQLDFKTLDKSVLMSRLYDEQPSVIIIDLDSYVDSSLEMISSILSMNYVPAICISSTKESSLKMKHFSEAIEVQTAQLIPILKHLINQAIHFSSRFNHLSSTYDTLDLMNSALYSSIDAYLQATKSKEVLVIAKFLKLIYTDNYFLANKPSALWVISLVDDQLFGICFIFSATNLECFKQVRITDKNALIFGDSLKSGFLKNFGEELISDIDNLTDLLPLDILSVYSPSQNIISCGTVNTLLIGCDYNQTVTQYDVNIIQALAIKFDLVSSVRSALNEVQDAFIYTMDALARAAEAKDDMTGHHIKRVNLFSKVLAEDMNLSEDLIREIGISAQMHDIGKIYVDESILRKPGKLTEEEFEELKKHTIYGERIIGDSKNLKHAAEIARSHHEKYDGTGYPDHKKGVEIPLLARIVSLADIYDALRSKRTYKPGFTHEESYRIIVCGDGRVEPTHFDPQVLEAFISAHLQFDEIYELYKD